MNELFWNAQNDFPAINDINKWLSNECVLSAKALINDSITSIHYDENDNPLITTAYCELPNGEYLQTRNNLSELIIEFVDMYTEHFHSEDIDQVEDVILKLQNTLDMAKQKIDNARLRS